MTAERVTVVLSSFYFHSLVNGIESSLGVFIYLLKGYFKENEEDLSWISALLWAWVGIVSIPAGALIPILGFRVLATLGSTLVVLGLALGSISPSLTYLYVSFGILAATGLGFLFILSLATVQHCFDGSPRKSLALGIASSGSGAGLFVLPPLIQKAASLYSWRVAMAAVSAYSFIGTFIGLFLRFEYRNDNVEVRGNRAPFNNTGDNPESVLQTFRPQKASSSQKTNNCSRKIKILKLFCPKYLVLVVSTMLFQWGKNMITSFLPSFVAEKGLNPDHTPWVLAVLGIFSVIGRVGAASLADLRDCLPLSTWLVIYGTIGGIAVFFLSAYTAYTHVLITVAVFGFCQGAKLTLPCLLMREIVGFDYLPLALGFLSFAQGMSALATPLGGWINDRLHTRRDVFSQWIPRVFIGTFAVISMTDEHGRNQTRIAEKSSQTISTCDCRRLSDLLEGARWISNHIINHSTDNLSNEMNM